MEIILFEKRLSFHIYEYIYMNPHTYIYIFIHVYSQLLFPTVY